jgi:hypothetical protein
MCNFECHMRRWNCNLKKWIVLKDEENLKSMLWIMDEVCSRWRKFSSSASFCTASLKVVDFRFVFIFINQINLFVFEHKSEAFEGIYCIRNAFVSRAAILNFKFIFLLVYQNCWNFNTVCYRLTLWKF